VQLKENAKSYTWKNYYGKKVQTVNADDVEWVECEHVNKTGLISQLDSKVNNLKNQLDLPPKKHQSKEKKSNPSLMT
jgi:hypothetical protein